jgi:hypothetical protein
LIEVEQLRYHYYPALEQVMSEFRVLMHLFDLKGQFSFHISNLVTQGLYILAVTLTDNISTFYFIELSFPGIRAREPFRVGDGREFSHFSIAIFY